VFSPDSMVSVAISGSAKLRARASAWTCSGRVCEVAVIR
jgi:hypothetical protein